MVRQLIEVGALVAAADTIIAGPAYILLNGGAIEAVGRGPYAGDRTDLYVVNRSHTIAIPGLVNSHGHAAMTLLRGIHDDVPLQQWLNDAVLPTEDKLTNDAIYWGTLLACWEMLRSGTTCFTDMYMFMHDAARAVETSGMRGVLSWGMVGFDQANHQRGLNNNRALVERWNHQANGRITVTLGPHAPYTCPPDTLRAAASLADELNVPIQIHLSETRLEVDDAQRAWGCSPIVHVDRCGLLDRPVLAAHCVHVSDEDIALMAAKGVRVAHNPQSNLKLASGIAPVARMRAAGVVVGLGTDGAASNNNLDMFEELRLAATLHKGISGDSTLISAAEALCMATEDSAKCVFMPTHHGRLQAGAPADFVLLDADSPHFTPTHDLLSNVVYAAGADDVLDVYVQGHAVLRNRVPTLIDTERVLFEVRRIKETLLS